MTQNPNEPQKLNRYQQIMESNLIALFAFEENENGIALIREMHYRLVQPENMTQEDLSSYRSRPMS